MPTAIDIDRQVETLGNLFVIEPIVVSDHLHAAQRFQAFSLQFAIEHGDLLPKDPAVILQDQIFDMRQVPKGRVEVDTTLLYGRMPDNSYIWELTTIDSRRNGRTTYQLWSSPDDLTAVAYHIDVQGVHRKTEILPREDVQSLSRFVEGLATSENASKVTEKHRKDREKSEERVAELLGQSATWGAEKRAKELKRRLDRVEKAIFATMQIYVPPAR